MPRLFRFAVSLSALAVAACSSGLNTPQGASGASSDTARLYAEYLSASYADRVDAADDRARFFSAAFAREDGDIGLGQRAFLAAFEAGQYDLAKALAINLQNLDQSEGLSRSFLSANAMNRGQWTKAQGYQTGDIRDRSVELVLGLMTGWTHYAKGEVVKAAETFENFGKGDVYFSTLGQLQVAELMIKEQRWDEAEKAIDAVQGSGLFSTATVLARTDILVGRGDKDEAISALDTIAELNGGFTSGPIKKQMDALAAGTYELRDLTPQRLTANALTEPSLAFFARQGAEEAAEIFLRTALRVDPSSDIAQLYLGTVLEQQGREAEAIEQYKAVSSESVYGISAMLAHANILFNTDRRDAALDLIQKAHNKAPSDSTRASLAQTLLAMENYAEALPIYNEIIADAGEDGLRKNPVPLYYRGICYEQMDQWPLAEQDFLRAIEYNPDDANALNYLGYTWVDQGVKLDEAFALIRRAVTAAPNSGAIVDSLGWAHYKLGQYEQARIELEKAVALTPDSATIIDHLGDTYWKLGRFREAGYQWQRALDFSPEPDEEARIRAKLKGGLDAASGQ